MPLTQKIIYKQHSTTCTPFLIPYINRICIFLGPSIVLRPQECLKYTKMPLLPVFYTVCLLGSIVTVRADEVQGTVYIIDERCRVRNYVRGKVVYIYTSLRGQVRARVIATPSHNNAPGQCRDSTSPFQKASSCEPSNGSRNTEAVAEVKKINYIYPCPFSPYRLRPSSP